MSKKALDALYSARWMLGKESPDLKYVKDNVSVAIDELTGVKVTPEPEVPVDQPEPERPSQGETGKLLMTIPDAIIHPKKMKEKGTYAGGYPIGAVVHYSAGRSLLGLKDTNNMMNSGIGDGYTYLGISRDGRTVQAHPLDKWGNHCGESKWPGLGSSLSSKLIGIEVTCAGKLDKISDNQYKSWFGEIYTKDQVRYVEEKEWECPTGYYLKFTPEQEKELVRVLVFLYLNDPKKRFSFDNVLAHHEVSGKKGLGYWRKTDCGGSLSMPMSKFRAHLKTLV